MSSGTGQPLNNPPEQLSLLSEKELANLKCPPSVPPLLTESETTLSFEADGAHTVHRQDVEERAANNGGATQPRLPGFYVGMGQ